MRRLSGVVWIFALALVFFPAASLYADSSPSINAGVAATGNKSPSFWKVLGEHKGKSVFEKYYDVSMGQQAVRFRGTIGLVGKGGLKGQLVSRENFTSNSLSMVRWNMDLYRDFQVSFLLQTKFGERQLSYTASRERPLKVTENIFHFTISNSKLHSGWVAVERDLIADLNFVEPGNTLQAIKVAVVAGSGAITPFHFSINNSRALYAKKNPPAAVNSVEKVVSKVQQQKPPIIASGTEPELAAAMPGYPRRSVHLNDANTGQLDIQVDGEITESQWHTASVANDFFSNDQRVNGENQTEVRVLSDQKNLYFAFRCFDNNPNLVTAIKTLRDGGLGIDDAVSVRIDAYRDYDTAATYSINAIGTQNDELSSGSAKKIQWKGDWLGATKKTDYGWSAEIAIPFDILKFNGKSDTFGINFSRYHHRTVQTSVWVKPSTSKNKDPSGLLTGLVLPQAKSNRVWTFMPYVVAGKNMVDRDGTFKDQSFDGGVTVRYEPTNNFSGVLELRPDFSQIESQISDIDFSYNEKEQTDNRTFFQEGSAYFGDESQYFYSPRVPNFNAGLKSFMQDGRNVFGALAVSSPDGRVDIHSRYRRSLGTNSGVTLNVVAYDEDEHNGQVLAAGVDHRFESGVFYDLNSSLARNNIADAESVGGSGRVLLGIGRNNWEFGIKSDYYEAEYQPATGLLNSDLPGTRAAEAYASFYKEGMGSIRQINGDVSVVHRQTNNGLDQNNGLYLSTDFEVLAKSRLQLAYNRYEYRPVSDEPGVFSDSLNEDQYWSANLDFNIYSSRFGYGAFFADGILGGGDYRYLSGYAWFNPTDNTSLKVSSEELESFGIYRQTTVSGGWDISARDGLVARYSHGDNYRQTRVAYRRKVNSGVDAFIAAQKLSDADSEITGKFVWTF